MSCYFCGLEPDLGVPFVEVLDFDLKRLWTAAENTPIEEFIIAKVACPRCDPRAPVIVLTEKMKWLKKMDELEGKP